MAAKKTGNPNDFILPDLGEGVHEAELIAWKVEAGQTVAEHEILAEMETDKALVEVPSPRAGTIAKLHGKPGEIMKVGEPLVSYEGGDSEATKADARTAAAPDAAAKSNGTHKKKGAPAPEREQPTAEAEEEREDDGTVVGQLSKMAGVDSGGKVLATPAVRRLARDMGVDLASVTGTGIAGRITAKDVKAVASGAAAPASRGAPAAPTGPSRPHSSVVESTQQIPQFASTRTPEAPAPSRETANFPAGAESQRIPFRGVRRTIANRLRESVNQAVHFNVMDEADVTTLDALRRRLAAASGEKVSFLPFVASALCRVLTDERFRSLNATVDAEANGGEGEIVQHRAVHMGIATDTDTGLMVPVIRDCDSMGVLQIGRAVAEASQKARDRSISRDRLVGSTFTISNVGSHAGRFATPIINYPEVGIIAVGRAHEAMVVRNGWFRVGKLLPLSLACDHRVVDGATAALALAEIVRLLQEPEGLMTPARG